MKRPAFEIVQAEGRSSYRTKGWLLRPVPIILSPSLGPPTAYWERWRCPDPPSNISIPAC